MPYISSGLFFSLLPAGRGVGDVSKHCQNSTKRKDFFQREKKRLFTFNSSCCKDVQEFRTTSLQSSLIFTAGRRSNSDRSLVFGLVGHFCSAPK